MNQSNQAPSGKKLPLFYAIYLSCILVAIVALCFGMVFLRSVLEEYESVQAKYSAKEVFDTYFTDFSYRNVQDRFDLDAFLSESGYETSEELFAALDDIVQSGELNYYRSSSGIENTVQYTVTVNKMKIATFTLKLGTETTSHGFQQYDLENITFYNPIKKEVVTNDETNPPIFYYTYTITAPLTHTVTVNGVPLTESDRTGEIAYDTTVLSNSKSGFEGIPFVSYEVILDELPVVSAVDFNGDTVAPEYDEENYRYSFKYTFDKSVLEEYGDLAIEIAQKLAIYMQAGAKFDSIKNYYDPASDLYDHVEYLGQNAWMVNKFDSCDFEDQSVSEAYRYSETEISIRVALTQIGHKAGKSDSIDRLDYTFCFHLVGDEWLLYESYNN